MAPKFMYNHFLLGEKKSFLGELKVELALEHYGLFFYVAIIEPRFIFTQIGQ